MALNIDDPATWDLDDTDLVELANTGSIPTTDPVEETDSEVSTTEGVLTPQVPEEAPIQAADGKNTIPYSVLRDAREAARSARVRLSQLEQELEELKATAATAPPTREAIPQEAPTLPEDVKQKLDAIRENWGDDIAAQAERTYWLEQHVQYQNQALQYLSQKVQQQEQIYQQAQQARQQTEEDQITEAIAASPKLDAWAKAEDQSWFDRAVELHSVLVKTDPYYANASWYDRMKVLPDRVESLFGASFQKIDPRQVSQKIQEAQENPPMSLSDVGGGATPERTETQKLEDLEGNQLTAFMGKLAQDPQKLNAYLQSLSG